MSRERVREFREGKWTSPAEAEAFVAGGPMPAGDVSKLLEALTARGATEAPEHRLRCSTFQRIVEISADKALFVPCVRALRGADSALRAALVAILPKVNSVDDFGELVSLLRLPDPAVRRAASEVLQKVGGRSAYNALEAMVAESSFAGREEAVDAAVAMAGHHALPLLKAAMDAGSKPDKLYVLKYVGNQRFMAKAVPSALQFLTPLTTDLEESVAAAAVSAFASLCAEDEYFATISPLLQSPTLAVVKAAVDGLKRFKSARVTAALQRALRSGPNVVRFVVLNVTLSIATDDITPVLVDALGSKQLAVRTKAGEIFVELSRAGKLDAARTIVWLLRSRDVNVRRMAVEIAKSVPDPDEKLWPKLLRFLRDEDWWVRERVTDALLEMAGQRLTKFIVELLSDPSDIIRRFAVDVLARLRDANSIPYLVKTASNDPDWWTRERAIDTIASFRDARAIPYIVELMVKDSDVRVTCLQVLGDLDARAVSPRVAAYLEDPDADVRMAALKCLARFNDPSLAPAVTKLLADAAPTVRKLAKEILGRWNVSVQSAQAQMAPLDEWLMAMVHAGGDDLILQVDRVPSMKRLGATSPLGDAVMTADQVKALLIPNLTTEQLDELHGMRDVDFSHEVKSEGVRFRANVFRQYTGYAAVFRVIHGKLPDFSQLNLPPVVESFAKLSNGLVLVGGPTGSGKSTTLAALIDHINRTSSRHVVSIEDPIEVVHRRKAGMVTQREIGAHARSFGHALRSLLRQDPDVILVGEMRDFATIEFALTAADTGHLVFGTVHTTSADTVIDRIVNSYPAGTQDQARMALAGSLRGVLCQYLIRRKDVPGRVVATEVMINNDAIANLIRKGKTYQISSIVSTSRELGMQSMDFSLQQLVKEGKISAEEGYMKARNKKDFETLLGGAPVATALAPPGATRSRAPGTPSPATPAPPAAASTPPWGDAPRGKR